MKKILSFLFAIIFVAAFLTGCTETTATCESISNDINNRLDRLSMSVTKLDTISNDYLASPDIYPTQSSAVAYITPNPSSSEAIEYETEPKVIKHSIATTDYIHDNTLNTNELITDILINKLTDNLKCDSNGNCYVCGNNYGDCDSNSCNSCQNIIKCDENGNCLSCNKNLQIDQNGTCSNCNTSCVDGNCSSINYNAFNKASQNCGSKYVNPLESNTTLNVDTIAVTDNATSNDIVEDDATVDESMDEEFLIEDTPTIYTETNIDEYSAESSTTEPDDKPTLYYYYEEQSFTPENLKYKPRFISNTQIQDAENNINSYVIKIQKLYAMTADVIEANNKLAEQKNSVLTTIKDAKDISNRYGQLRLTPSMHQVQAINNYLQDIDNTTKYIKSANGKLNNEINNINNTNNLGVTNSVDVMNSNYLRILNHLDTRITYHEIALSTLDQLRVLLLDTLNSNTTDVPNNDDIVIEENIDDSTPDVEENTDIVDDTYDTDVVIPSEDDIVIEDNTDGEDNLNTEENNNTEENTNDESASDTTAPSSDDTVIVEDESSDNATIDDIIEDNNMSNIDTYRDDIIEDNNTNTVVEDNNTEIVPNNDTNDNNIQNSEIVSSNTAYNNNGIASNNVIDDVNNVHKNRNNIINENNINTDGNITNTNRYVYDENGKLYNRDTNLLNNGRHNNINTYEYNTLIDGLNQGTIDNGINNL